ncbi:3'-5' exonuclease [Apilactobacillus xinyiensis]|uniref:3'-5' exonuclease n=1 Tax=Apilactobacillus xinyiensis TaxID=2841032 RepID=UPI00201068BE|nr:3'-5' exonuclease [Apilactobacillus xinyiensis]MCL0330113.1 3'-5' exonuclease [Apilactobacillus xinyiensis]
MNFIAIDFETAASKRASACSVALIVVRNNKVVDEFYSLINPEVDFNWRNIKVHGIHEKDVQDAPTFPEIWSHLKKFFNSNQLVIAHNASFDNSVIKQSLIRYNLEIPKYLTLDTLKTSKEFYPDLTNHKLNTVCDALNIELKHHHNALDDSLACANILISQYNNYGKQFVEKFIKIKK